MLFFLVFYDIIFYDIYIVGAKEICLESGAAHYRIAENESLIRPFIEQKNVFYANMTDEALPPTTLNNSKYSLFVPYLLRRLMQRRQSFLFFTKIYEYLSSGKPILAIVSDTVASMEYLSYCLYFVSEADGINFDIIDQMLDVEQRNKIA